MSVRMLVSIQTKEFLRRNKDYIIMIKSMNPLHIMAGSEIFYNPQKYDITLPERDSNRRWYIGKENTYDIRANKVLELKREAKKLGILFTEGAESLEFTVNVEREFIRLSGITKRNKGIIRWLVLISVSLYMFIYIVYSPSPNTPRLPPKADLLLA